MSFYCCGIKYSKNDPETYWCIDTYVLTKPTKKNIKNKKIVKEVVDSLFCKKNGCTKIQITRFARENGVLIKVDFEELKGIKAQQYLTDTINLRIKQQQICPKIQISLSAKNDFVYGKTINSETQRIRYLNEQGWASEEKIISKVKYLQNYSSQNAI